MVCPLLFSLLYITPAISISLVHFLFIIIELYTVSQATLIHQLNHIFPNENILNQSTFNFILLYHYIPQMLFDEFLHPYINVRKETQLKYSSDASHYLELDVWYSKHNICFEFQVCKSLSSFNHSSYPC